MAESFESAVNHARDALYNYATAKDLDIQVTDVLSTKVPAGTRCYIVASAFDNCPDNLLICLERSSSAYSVYLHVGYSDIRNIRTGKLFGED